MYPLVQHTFAYFLHQIKILAVNIVDEKNQVIDGILMPYLANGSLKSFMKHNEGRVSLEQRIKFCIQIAKV